MNILDVVLFQVASLGSLLSCFSTHCWMSPLFALILTRPNYRLYRPVTLHSKNKSQNTACQFGQNRLNVRVSQHDPLLAARKIVNHGNPPPSAAAVIIWHTILRQCPALRNGNAIFYKLDRRMLCFSGCNADATPRDWKQCTDITSHLGPRF